MLQFFDANIKVLDECLYRDGIFTLFVKKEVEIEFVIVSGVVVSLIIGLTTFFFAMKYDIKDPHRVTRYAQNGFWLHLIAGYSIVSTLTGALHSDASTISMVALIALLLALSLISIIIYGKLSKKYFTNTNVKNTEYLEMFALLIIYAVILIGIINKLFVSMYHII